MAFTFAEIYSLLNTKNIKQSSMKVHRVLENTCIRIHIELTTQACDSALFVC